MSTASPMAAARAASAPTSSRAAGRWIVGRLLPLALVVALIGVTWAHRWTFEDGFINFRIIKQLEAGHGPVFNQGQRVEAYTSPLWLFTLTFFDIITPIRLEWLSVFLGIAFTAAGFAASIAASRQLWHGFDEDRAELPLGALVILATPPIWYFATSGLEGGIAFGWLGLCLLVLTRWALGTRRLSSGAWMLVGLGWLVRPELVLFSLGAACAVVVAEGSDRSLLRRAASSGWAWLIPAAYEIFRMGYFGVILPNTAYAKDASGARWHLGWHYFTQFVGNYWLWIAAAACVLAAYMPLAWRLVHDAEQRRLAVLVGWLAGTVFTTLYIIRVGGDYIDARLLLPSFFAFFAPVATARVTSALGAMAGTLAIGWAVLAAGTLRPPLAYRTVIGDPRPNVVTLSDALAGPFGEHTRAFVNHPYTIELRPIDGRPNPALRRPTAALSGVGVLGYYLGPNVDVLDLSGLADPVAAHFALTSRGLPGHEKFAPPAWSAARLLASGQPASAARFTVTGPLIRPLIPPVTGATFTVEVDAARRALSCGALRNLQRSYESRLTAGGFFHDIVDSVSNSRLSVPPDPETAERTFCGSG